MMIKNATSDVLIKKWATLSRRNIRLPIDNLSQNSASPEKGRYRQSINSIPLANTGCPMIEIGKNKWKSSSQILILNARWEKSKLNSAMANAHGEADALSATIWF
jgi:hypothetical protein